MTLKKLIEKKKLKEKVIKKKRGKKRVILIM